MPAEYSLTPFPNVVLHFHDDTVTSFRDDVESRENAAYQDWLTAGGVPDPYVVPLELGKTIAQRLGG